MTDNALRADLEQFFGEAQNPPFMAIGDSLFNGVRSATIHAELAALSPPAQMARALNIGGFVVPDYPRPVLLDAEEFLDKPKIGTLIDGALANAQAWLHPAPWSRQTCFDNIAFAGATIGDLMPKAESSVLFPDGCGRTFRENYALAEWLLQTLLKRKKNDLGLLGRLWFAINTSFVLNPSRCDAMAEATAFDIVAARKPRTLAISIGSNDGLFGAILPGGIEKKRKEIDSVPERFAAFGAAIAELPREIESIAVTNLIRPTAVANLSPRSDGARIPGCGRYFDSYISRIGDAAAEITGDEARAFDEFIADVNARAAEKLRDADVRITIVDVYDMVDAYDGKHGCKPGVLEVVEAGTARGLDNRVYRHNNVFGFLGGGLFGLDNMHPSGPGYSILADRTLEALGMSARADAQWAYERDTLLQSPPRYTELAQIFVGLLGSLGTFGAR